MKRNNTNANRHTKTIQAVEAQYENGRFISELQKKKKKGEKLKKSPLVKDIVSGTTGNPTGTLR